MTTLLSVSAATPPAAENGDLQAHIDALGLLGISSYKLWCRRHGFPMELEKSLPERQAELDFLRLQAQPEDPDADRAHDPRCAELIRQVAAGEFDGRPVTDLLSRVRNLFAEVRKVEGGHEALLQLLLHVEKYGNLLNGTRGFVGLGQTRRNLVISGLSQLVRHPEDWIRPIEDWRPGTRKPQGQFYELARYLFARYPVPGCLNAAWFEADPEEAATQQRWYRHVGSGQNIRTAEGLPFRLTKRAAHIFMNSSLRARPLMMLRRAQITALCGDIGNGRAWSISADERIMGRDHADFWTGIVHFLLNNPMLERNYIGPLVDYIHYTKFEERRIPQPDGSVRRAPPEHPRFAIKARSINKLVCEVDAWHEQLTGGEYGHVEEWGPSGIREFALTEDNEKLGERIHWTIQELRSSALLQVEGRVMHHCVGSYAKRCIAGENSIWSIRFRTDEEEAEQQHVLTFAVDNKKRQVTQARGKCNLQPHGTVSKKQHRKTDNTYRAALRESARVMALWRKEEGLGYSQD